MDVWESQQTLLESSAVHLPQPFENETIAESEISYEAQVGEGEISQRKVNGVLEIFVGNKNLGQTILSRWLNIAWLLLTLLAIVGVGQRYWAAYQFAATLPPQIRTLLQPRFPWGMMLVACSLIFPILNLTRRIRNAGQITRIQVSTVGISYKNSFGKKPDGFRRKT